MTTITQERNGWNAVAGHPAMRRRDQWGARRSYTDARTVTEPATRVFVHISITNPENYPSYDRHAQALEAIGIARFPNTGVSYNRGFMAGSPNVYELQPVGRRGAHTVNDFKRSTCSTSGCPGRGSSLTAPDWNLNYNARAYVWCANVQHAVPDAIVELFARAIYTDYKAGFITKAAAENIHGHRCVSAKSCPGDRMWARIDEIQARVNQLIANGPEDDMPVLDADDKEWFRSTVRAIFDEKARLPWHERFSEYVDENESGERESRTTADILFATHRLAYLAANPNIDALASAIVAKIPTAPGSIDLATVKQGVREVLLEGVAPSESPTP